MPVVPGLNWVHSIMLYFVNTWILSYKNASIKKFSQYFLNLLKLFNKLLYNFAITANNWMLPRVRSLWYLNMCSFSKIHVKRFDFATKKNIIWIKQSQLSLCHFCHWPAGLLLPLTCMTVRISKCQSKRNV